MSDDTYGRGLRADVNHTPGKHRGPRFSWTSQFEETFFQSLCESVQLGLREGSTFKPEAWDRAAQALLDRHNAEANKSHLINKSDNARKKYRLWRGLREDPDFLYDPASRTVTASEEVWRTHIEREPLSRSLKGRPFEHEVYYEVLFPDVIGTAGAPKRITKPRRKTDGMGGSDDLDVPSTAVMNMLADATYDPSAATHAAPPAPVPPTITSTTAIPVPIPVPVPNAARPTSTVLPPRSSIASTSALTPPDENAPHARKRLLPPDSIGASGAAAPTTAHPEKRRRVDNSHSHASTSSNAPGPASASGQDGIALLAEALRSAKPRPGWSEQAIEIFFRDFADEDMDLQLKIAEKALTDENKAMVFLKMPAVLRKHWVKRLREVHLRSNM